MALVFVHKFCIEALSNNLEGMNAPEKGHMRILKNLSINHVRGPHGGGVEEWWVGVGERRGEGEGKGREGGGGIGGGEG